jgi:hypothetical protein
MTPLHKPEMNPNNPSKVYLSREHDRLFLKHVFGRGSKYQFSESNVDFAGSPKKQNEEYCNFV